MSRLYATDYVKLPKSAIITDEGYLFIQSARIARIGVQEYFGEGGQVIRRFRPPEEVEKSAPSFNDRAVTLDHPPDYPVTADNAAKYLKGLSQNSNYRSGWLESDLKITHAEAVKAATSTHRQLSCGYTFVVDATPGEWVDTDGVQGEPGKVYPYDEIMRDIEGNHVALVQFARAGSNATWDSINIEVIDNSIGVKTMDLKKGSILDPALNRVIEYHAQDTNEVVELVNGLRGQLDKANDSLSQKSVELDSKSKELSRVEGENAGLKTRVSELESKVQELESRPAMDGVAMAEWFKTYEAVKGAVSLDGVDAFSMSVVELKKHYLKAINPAIAIDGKPDEFIEGVWAVASVAPKTTDELKSALDNAQPKEGQPRKVADINKRKNRLGKFD